MAGGLLSGIALLFSYRSRSSQGAVCANGMFMEQGYSRSSPGRLLIRETRRTTCGLGERQRAFAETAARAVVSVDRSAAV